MIGFHSEVASVAVASPSISLDLITEYHVDALITSYQGNLTMNYDPIYSSSQVAKVCGLTHVTFRSRLSRGLWRIVGKSQAADILGKGHLFTIFDVMGYALAEELVKMGIDGKIAFDLAMTDFAHVGSADRDPADVFPVERGRTLYVYSPGNAFGEVIATGDVENVIELFCAKYHTRSSRCILIDLNDMRARVLRILATTAHEDN